MHWDIDKNLSDLLASNDADPIITKVTISFDQCQDYGIDLPKCRDVEQSRLRIWCISLGYSNQARLVIYGMTIREVYLRARKAIKDLSPEALQAYGLKGPKKHKFKKTPKHKDFK